MWERWYEAILEEKKLLDSKDVTVQCVDFCEAMTSKVHTVLQHTPFDLRGEPFGNILVFMWQLLNTKKSHTCACRYSMLPCSRFLEVQTYYSGCWPLRSQWLLDEIQRQPSVSVLSGPATVITNISVASAFLADGWSTESVRRVVRTGIRQENNERDRAEHRKMKQNSPHPSHCRHDDKFRGFMRTWETHQIAACVQGFLRRKLKAMGRDLK